MKQQKQNDLGKDSIGMLLFKLAIPAITAQLVNALYNIVDRIYIAKIPNIGDLALTGVGVTFPIIMVISAFSAFIGMGGAPKVAIKMGEGKLDEAENILGNSVVSLVAISITLTTVFLIWGEQLLLMFGASENTIVYATQYMSIYVMGTIFVQMALGLNSFISTQGFAKTAMLTVLIGAVTNIILDPILIFGLNMGVRGAAVATVLSQAVSAIWVLKFLLSKKSKIQIKKKHLRFSTKVMLPVLALGISPFIMQSTEGLVNIVLNSSLQKYGGDIAVGSMTIIGSVMQFCLMPIAGLTQAGQPIISFNYGAKQMDRVKKAFRYLLIASLSYACVLWATAMFVPRIYVNLFAENETLAVFATWSMRIFMSGIFAMGAQLACQQCFVSLGQAKISVLLALLRKIVILIPLVYILPNIVGDKFLAILTSIYSLPASANVKVVSVFFAEPIADLVASITAVIVFSFTFNKILDKKMAENVEESPKVEMGEAIKAE